MKFCTISFYILFGILIGCSNKVKISGTVIFSDGEPVNFGCVCFDNNGKTYYGYLDNKGHYSPGELKDGDGVPCGNYKIWLSGTVLSEEILDKEGESTGKSYDTFRVTEKYTSPKTTDLKFEVKHGGSKTFDFTVERPDKQQNQKNR